MAECPRRKSRQILCFRDYCFGLDRRQHHPLRVLHQSIAGPTPVCSAEMELAFVTLRSAFHSKRTLGRFLFSIGIQRITTI
jgi:hypothetical protein